jgi:hypothetical protein
MRTLVAAVVALSMGCSDATRGTMPGETHGRLIYQGWDAGGGAIMPKSLFDTKLGLPCRPR